MRKRARMAWLAAALPADFRFDLLERLGAKLLSDRHQLLAIRIAAVYFVKTARRIAGPSDNRGAKKRVVDERAGVGPVEQAGAGSGCQTNGHLATLFHRWLERATRL